MHLNQPIVGMAATPDGKGYWLVASDGGIFTFGDAGYFGSAPASNGHGNVVALASASNGQGYWVAGGDGGIDPFGAAPSEGSMSGPALNRPIVGFAAEPQGIPGAGVAGATLRHHHFPGERGGRRFLRSQPRRVRGHGPLLVDEHRWRASSGLTLAPGGTISGIPSAPGQSTFTIEVADARRPWR